MKGFNIKNIVGKKITIIGSGLSGMAAAKLASYLGANVFISDRNKISKNFGQYSKNIKYEEGIHSNRCYDCDCAIISPGISTNNSFFNAFKSKKIQIISEIEFAFWFTKSTIIAMTGSNGKSTTVSLLKSVLINHNKNTYLGGNIGVPFSENVLHQLENNVENSIHILELSSFQLERIDCFKPKIACILNLSEDHLDRYASIKDYYNAKFNILKNLNNNCYFIYNENEKNLYKNINLKNFNSIKFGIKQNKSKYYLDVNNTIKDRQTDKILLNCDKLHLKGKHNIENILVVLQISELLKIDDTIISQSILGFYPLEHRMEIIRKKSNVTFINDSKGTNTSSTIQAIKSSKQKTILILGGYSKGRVNYKGIFNITLKNIKHIVCYGVEGKSIYKQLKNIFICTYIENFEKAIISAIALAKANYRVLLSPACSSFDQFNNFEERGNKFKELVKNYSTA